ncbi:hypothetical protein NS115_09490 [Paenibacillus jamilae]|uniref:Uncharacterized protein n=1 Tax=Paenibacillus jamilae TaxID=114136 RepID=A0ACC4ZW91_9BACL|nr:MULTISPECIES: hypothetical protein [Paenibacillus]MBU9709942.1 hypothetical protein [Paenibacillus sp. AK121]MCV9952321.1 hypothetical protein [Paenibacillus sp. BT-177]AJE53799.1 hypothetical protein RE92_23410 [Paenibacillus polymyxa]AUO08629.1 hypothetical protein C0638_19760 [Paenibacillus sp. lzh-N1]AZH29743.1 hypothetical protein EGM68_13755 [Paenibacillus sp. M-152]
MLSAFLYILLGFFDALAAVTLVLKLYMLPVWENRRKILFYAIGIAFFSFLMREVIGMPKFDFPLQYLLMVLFLRFGLGIKTYLAAFSAGSGLTAYINLQLFVYIFANFFGVAQPDIINNTSGSSIYVIQLASIFTAYFISFVMGKYNFGFSFIIQPPHDFLKGENYLSPLNKMFIIGSLISFVTILVTLYMLYNSNTIGLLSISLLTFGISYFFSEKGDYEDARNAIEAHRIRNKES